MIAWMALLAWLLIAAVIVWCHQRTLKRWKQEDARRSARVKMEQHWKQSERTHLMDLNGWKN